MNTHSTALPFDTSPQMTQEARYFLAAIVQSCEDSIVTIDFNNVITNWNKGAERLYGYSAAEVIGKSLTMLTLPEDVKQLLVNVDQIKHHKKVERFETVRVHKQGQLIDLEIELSPVLNDAGDVIGVSTFARDITKRKRAEADLAFLAEVSKDLVDLTDITEAMSTVGQKLGMHFSLSHCHFMEMGNRHSKGTIDYLWKRAGAENSPTQQEFSALLTSAFLERSMAGETIVVNDVFTDRVSNSPALASMGVRSFVTVPVVQNGALHFWLGYYDHNVRTWRADEISLMRELTTRIWIRLERARAEIALRKSEAKLRELNARLQESDKAKTAFFNNVSHEFRTPLTLLLGPLEDVIRSGASKLSPEDLQSLQYAHRSATRLQKLVTTLLDFARIEAGKLEAYYQPADFSKVTTELASTFRSAIERVGLKYVVKAENISEPIYLNREMWEKIVFNLLSNAFKFTHKGKIEVVIREKKKHAELRIKDTGAGIAPKDHERIFERFARIEQTRARTNEGTGIGLALVRELVAAHGGVIKVKSTEGEGSEFIVSIPKGKQHFAKHQIFENRERQPVPDLKEPFADEILGWLPEDVKNSRRKLKQYQKDNASKIIVVDDNADMRKYLSSILSDYSTLEMEDGEKALKFLQEGGQADLILSDVMMPSVDGFDMLKNLKRDPKFTHIPVVLLTAKVSEDSKIKGLEAGADAYVMKPFSAKELRAIVHTAIKRAHHEQPQR